VLDLRTSPEYAEGHVPGARERFDREPQFVERWAVHPQNA